MTESVFRIPGNTPEHGETLGVPQQHLDDARVEKALLAVRKALGPEYKPSPEVLKHTRHIGNVTQLHVRNRHLVASDIKKVA
jgi:hypothetical protein